MIHPLVTMLAFTAGVAQFGVKLGDNPANLKKALGAVEKLAGRGADMVVLPEMWPCGFDNRNIAEHAKATPHNLDAIARAAAKFNVLVVGSMPEKGGRGIYNTAFVVDPQAGVIGKYRKVHLFSASSEPSFFEAGNRAVTVVTRFGRMGLMICFDLRFPELARALTLAGAQFIVICAQWPKARAAHWDILTCARAVENQVFVVAANRCGSDPGLSFAGDSRILSPWGQKLAQAGVRDANITAKLDPAVLSRIRKELPCLTRRVPKAYEV
ncbi:MAG: carbon-nitrogen family hydrolase [Desulfatibacillaceae bacterium]|nr:carbon-nitrogen family hydrolase [Desulfatibacillaceae bacterium]